MGLFPAANEDRQMKFSVMIPITSSHLVYTLFCPSVCSLYFKGHKPYSLKGFIFFVMFLHITYIYIINIYLILIANARKIATITRNIPIRNPVLEPTHSLNLEHISKRFFFHFGKTNFFMF